MTKLDSSPITYLANVLEPSKKKQVSLSEALAYISSGFYRPLIEQLRTLNKQEYTAAKKSLPAFCFSGCFEGAVTNANFKKSSGLFPFDIDNLDSQSIEQNKVEISDMPSCVFCFVSPSGTGLKGALRVDPEKIKSDSDFKRIYPQVSDFLREVGFNIDQACKDVRRLCFVSCDPDIYVNYNAELFPVIETTASQKPAENYPKKSINIGNDEEKCIDRCISILQSSAPGTRHDARLRAGRLAGGFISAGRVAEAKIVMLMLAVSDGIADGGKTSQSERKTIMDAIEGGKKSPAQYDRPYLQQNHDVDYSTMPAMPVDDDYLDSLGTKTPLKLGIYNAVLDEEKQYCSVDLLRYLPDDHLLKRLSIDVSAATFLPVNTVLLMGLAVFSSMASWRYCVPYPNGRKLPIGLYVVAEQPPGTGKTWALGVFQAPFYQVYRDALEENSRALRAYAKMDADKLPLTDSELSERELLTEKAKRLDFVLFVSNATPEGLERNLENTNGFFAAVSSEQGLFNTLLGATYKSGETHANNNDLILNGFDGGHIGSVRVTRKGYKGRVAGGVACFAQAGSVERIMAASNGTGLSERFLALVEPHMLGRRDHTKRALISSELEDRYRRACLFFADVIKNPQELNVLESLTISEEGFNMIDAYRNSIELHLLDGGRFSHVSLRGAAGKIDMQIMKLAANLYLTCGSESIVKQIPDSYVKSAIDIAAALLEANLALCRDKGLMGVKAEFSAILALFERDQKPRTARAIVQTVHKTKPFCEFTGSKSQLVKDALSEMVIQRLLASSIDSEGKTIFSLAQ